MNAGAHREAFAKCLEHVWASARPGDSKDRFSPKLTELYREFGPSPYD